MQDQRIEKIAAFAVNITKVLAIIYFGLVEVFKIGKLTRKILVIARKRSARFGLSSALGALGRRFESCRPDWSLSD